MKAEIGARRDGPHEASLVALFLGDADRYMTGVDATVTRGQILSLEPEPEPEPKAYLDKAACQAAFLAIAGMIDLRMPFTLGHSRAVAVLCAAAGRFVGLPASDICAIRWAAYVQDIGELSVPVST